jgi:cytosine/adenosine deaminase-related metal-dependent hydrolase
MIFDNATIITINPQREIISHGAVVVEGRKIAAVGRSKHIVEKYPEKKRIDCNGNILLPGLIDTHVHLAQCLLRGMSEGGKLENFSNWLLERTWPLQGSFTKEDGRASAALCILEMLKSGTTGFIECLLAGHYGLDGIADVCVQSGIRAALGRLVMDISPETRDSIGMHPGMWESRQHCLQGAVDAYDKWEGGGNGRLQIWFGCRSYKDYNNPSIFDEVSQIAQERNMGITMHHTEMLSDIDFAKSQGYRSPTEFTHSKGIMGPRTVLAHYCVSDEEDWKLSAGAGTNISHNPANNSTAGWGPAPITEMLEAGVKVSLGCDGAPSNANMDLLRDLRVACHAARLRKKSRMALSSEAVLEMATLGGAHALGLEDQVGSIEVGKKADFIIINTDVPHLQPVWNPVSAVVFGAQGSDVDTVVIDGQIIMQGRKILTMDEEAIIEDVRQRYRHISQRAGVEIAPNWEII